MADTELRGHELKVYKPQVHLDKLYVNISFQSELSMHGIVYRLHFYVATLLKISKENLTVFSRIGNTNKLSAFSLVSHSLWWVVR